MLPLDDRVLERLNAALVGRPDLMAGRTSLTLREGMTGMSENVFINMKNRSFSVTAETKIPSGGAEGVLLSQAGRFGGWSFYLKDGKPMFTYNWLGEKAYTIAASKAVLPGAATIRFDFAYDGGGAGKGGAGTITVNGEQVAQGRIEKTQGFAFSADEGADVGCDMGTAVSDNYQVPFTFTGTIDKVTVDLKPTSATDKAESDQVRQNGAMKKALSD